MARAGFGQALQVARNIPCEGNWQGRAGGRTVGQWPPKHDGCWRRRKKRRQTRKYNARREKQIQLVPVAKVVEVCPELERMSTRNNTEVIGQLHARFAIEVHVRCALAGDDQV